MVENAAMLFDILFPRWQFREVHRLAFDAAPGDVLQAIESATWRDFPMLRTLMTLASLGRWRPPRDGLVFDDFLGTGPALARADDEIVFGWVNRLQRDGDGSPLVRMAPEQFTGFAEPRHAKVGFNFRYRDGELSTQTRVLVTDARTRWLFRLYWLSIRLPGGLVRREWLRGIRRRVAQAQRTG
ncbi:hypothetical protein EDD30_0710 [Couchioplanes caeruleus]|nr:hypothetical protein EDD30_0710 [Couchioplanes caeruleus]